MIKKYLTFSSTFFSIFTIWEWISDSQIYWIENIGITICATLVNAFVDWGISSYDYRKKEIQGE
ncbi:hypothetical protein SporoP8_11030 [Sporosarcina ureae]|uniref:hypothetical protein n=1 Tax=Sporosarcina ureae TaxID=1571 RepID=UPI000A16137E|nr:hypothetical protein [Sporosarcina ureae]ARJ39359.1 hypothetical protein SporoP8_11030 [Sporosarcina ureae]